MPSFWDPIGPLPECDWSPSVDVYRAPEGWIVKIDLAGVRREDVEIGMEGSTLSVRGVRRDWIVEEGWRHHSMEISYCRFSRSIALPEPLAGAAVAAEHCEGMLIVRIRTGKEEE